MTWFGRDDRLPPVTHDRENGGHMTDLLLKWTCSGADPDEAGRLQVTGELTERVHDYADRRDNIVITAIECHPEPERVARLMDMAAIRVFANELADGDVSAWINPLVDLDMAERYGVKRMPNRVQLRPRG
jgi:hypothetical protein